MAFTCALFVQVSVLRYSYQDWIHALHENNMKKLISENLQSKGCQSNL